MATKERMLTVAEVYEMSPGDAENATWINPGMIATVIKMTRIETGKLRWPCQLVDPDGTSASLEMTIFAAPKFREGDVIEISGKGFRRTEYNGKAQVAVGKETEIHIIGKAPAAGHAPAHPPAGGHGPAPAERPGDVSEFHRTFKRMALMYCHAMDYADKIAERTPFAGDEQYQACVSTLFIEGARRNLIDIVPARGPAPAPAAAAPPPTDRSAPATDKPKGRDLPIEDDVPF